MKRDSISAGSQTDFERLRALSDAEIVCDDDAPEWTDEMFARAVIRIGLRPKSDLHE